MIKGVLLDLSGVIYIGSKPIAGAQEAIDQLHTHNLPARFITNTTRSTSADILKKLSTMRFNISKDLLFTAPLAAKQYIKEKGLTPYLLVHSNLMPEFSDFPDTKFNAVLLGDAGKEFNYEKLNIAFRLLFSGAPLFAMGANRYFKEEDGFSLDAGPFVRALETASGVKATILGKPSKEFFLEAIKGFACTPEQVVMIGDDVESDINGATAAGLQAILVKTGKYRSNDDSRLRNNDVRIAQDIRQAIGWICK